jgi:hypothetical protein
MPGRITVEEAERFIFERVMGDAGRFYGPPDAAVALGAGLIFSGVLLPLYIRDEQIFVTVEGVALVLTHECDIDQANPRAFNRDVLVAPLVPFGLFFQELANSRDDVGVKAYLGNLAAGRITQLIYFPTIPDRLPYGAVLYLNRICWTDIEQFDPAKCLGALTGFGLERFDRRLQEHLLRPKIDRLPLT